MSHIEPVIRPARDSDADAIARLHAESWRATARGVMSDDFLDERVFEERRREWSMRLGEDNSRFLTLVAVQREGLHGFICFELDADAQWGSELDSMHIDPELCGRGLGEALMRVGILQLEELRPGQPMHLFVFEANTRAQRFYERLGGRADGRVDLPLPAGEGSSPAIRYVWPAPVTLRHS